MSMLTLSPKWPAPANVVAYTTLREMGNLASHVGDDPKQVAANRAHLLRACSLPQEPYWLNQTHSDKVLVLDKQMPITSEEADGSYAGQPNIVCAVLTADCLPVLLCEKQGKEVAALHAGWRGLLGNILVRGVEQFQCPPADILAWLGPAIGPTAFEVGPEVYTAFVGVHDDNKTAFSPSPKDEHYFLDIYTLARAYLNRLGVVQIYGGEYCTFEDASHFYSYRRDGQTGRMASLIWRT